MGFLDVFRETVKSVVETPVKVVKTGVDILARGVERTLDVDIPGVGYTREELNALKSQPKTKKSTPPPAPVKAVQETVQKVASSEPVQTVSKAVNEVVASVERYTGVDLPGGMSREEVEMVKPKAPAQQYMKKATNMENYGVGVTQKVVAAASQAIGYTPTKPPSMSPQTFLGPVVTTVAGGLAFIPDTIVELGKGGIKTLEAGRSIMMGHPKEAQKKIQEALFHVSRPVAVVGAGLYGAGKQVAEDIMEMADVHKAQTQFMASILLNPREAPEKAKRLNKEMWEAGPRALRMGGSILGMYLTGKAYQTIGTHISNIKTKIETKLSNKYLKPKEIKVLYDPTKQGGTGKVMEVPGVGKVYVTEDATIPRSLSYLKKLEGKNVTSIHMTASPELAKALKQGEFVTKGFPEMAKGFRKEYDMLHFYVSAPGKDEAVAYGFYAGISSKGQSGIIWDPKAIFRFRRPNPQMVVVEGKVQTPKELYVLGSKFRKTGDVSIIKEMAVKQGKTPGKIQVPVENIAQFGPYHYEGQLIIPSQFKGKFGEYPGTVLKTEYKGWTTYTPPRPSTGIPLLDTLREIVSPRKIYKIDIWKASIKGPASTAGASSSSAPATLKITPDYYSGKVPATVWDVSREVGRVASGGLMTAISQTTTPEQPGRAEYFVKDIPKIPERPTEKPKEEPPTAPEQPRPEPPKPEPHIRPIRRPRRRPETRPPGLPEPPKEEPPRPAPRIRYVAERMPKIEPPRPRIERPRYMIVSKVLPIIGSRRQSGGPGSGEKGITFPRLGLFGGRKKPKSLLADLYSVTKSQALFGKATHPRPTENIWKKGEKSLFMKVPTLELMKAKKKKTTKKKARKGKSRKSRKGVLL